MSTRLATTEWSSWDGPVLSAGVQEEIEVLRKLLEQYNFNYNILHEVAGKMKTYYQTERPTTKDGYTWFWAPKFNLGKGSVAILIPWAGDSQKTNGSKFDRRINVYFLGNVEKEGILETIRTFVRKLKTFFESESYQEILKQQAQGKAAEWVESL